ncbi:hypothetical protein [Brevundimonas bullata]|uniref:hypothetical protein n=1 Tax=Brevundimonas bullata TaxID=13160 RepID=UPI002FD9A76B
MEEFFGLLERNLKAKYKSLQAGSIQPFLGSVVVDVATPETRAIPMNELILERLDDLAKRISRSENRTSHFMPARPRKAGDVLFRTNEEKSTAFYSVPTNSFDEVWGTIENDYSTLQVIGEDDGLVYIAASSTPSRSSESAKETALAAMVRTFGGSLGVPERYTKAYR